MNPLYTTKTKYTFDEYKKFNLAITTSINKIHIKVICVDLLFILLAFLYSTISFRGTSALLLCAILFPLFIVFSVKNSAKRVYNSNKVAQDIEVEFKFFEDKFTLDCSIGTETIEYNKLYKVIETKENFYLLIAKNQGYIIVKKNCSEDLIKFLNEKK